MEAVNEALKLIAKAIEDLKEYCDDDPHSFLQQVINDLQNAVDRLAT